MVPASVIREAADVDSLTRLFRLGGPGKGVLRSFSRPPSGVILEDGSIVLNDVWSRQIRRYDASGELVWVAGREGEGPGEFTSVDWVGSAPRGRIAAWSASAAQISFFDGDGNYLDRRQVDRRMVAQRNQPFLGFFPDGSTPIRWISDFSGINASRPPGESVWRDSSCVVRYGVAGELADTLAVTLGPERYLYENAGSRIIISPLLGAEPLDAVAGGVAFLGDSQLPYLTGVSAEGDTVIRIGLELEDEATNSGPPSDFLPDLRASRVGDVDGGAPGPFAAAWQSAPVSENRPLWTGLKGVSDGTLWLGLFDTDRDGQTTWINLSSSGNYLRSIRLKAGSRILDVRDRRLLIGWEDDLNRPLVELHEIVTS